MENKRSVLRICSHKLLALSVTGWKKSIDVSFSSPYCVQFASFKTIMSVEWTRTRSIGYFNLTSSRCFLRSVVMLLLVAKKMERFWDSCKARASMLPRLRIPSALNKPKTQAHAHAQWWLRARSTCTYVHVQAFQAEPRHQQCVKLEKKMLAATSF